jgi:hypothetical protein
VSIKIRVVKQENARANLLGRLFFVLREFLPKLFLPVEDDKRGDDARHPSAQSEQESYDEGTAPLVNDGQWRKYDTQNDSKARHKAQKRLMTSMI